MYMKNIIGYTAAVISATVLFLTSFSCNNNDNAKKETVTTVQKLTKPFVKSPATYSDTLIINFPAAVFYHPDSLQLIKIKELTDSMVFDGSMHEYFYQMRNARMVIKKTWPGLTIVESKKYRFILFMKKDKIVECIDLNTKNDSYGLFVFNGIKSPVPVDMTNIETEISFYLKD